MQPSSTPLAVTWESMSIVCVTRNFQPATFLCVGLSLEPLAIHSRRSSEACVSRFWKIDFATTEQSVRELRNKSVQNTKRSSSRASRRGAKKRLPIVDRPWKEYFQQVAYSTRLGKRR